MSKFIPVDLFAEQQGINVTTLHVHKSTGRYPEKVFKKEKRHHSQKREFLLIDESYFKVRSDFHIRILNDLHEYYYVLNRYFNDMLLAELVQRVYPQYSKNGLYLTIKGSMFEVREAKLMGNPILSKQMWHIYRVFRHILRHIFRLKGLKLSEVDLMKLHDLGDKQ